MDRGVEMPKINQEEYKVLKGLDDKWKWIARDEDKALWVYTEIPDRKSESNIPSYWDTKTEEDYTALEFMDESHLFQFIQWEDGEPYEIAGLIREYEIKELRLAPSGTVIVDSFDESEETEVKDIEELKSWFEDDKLYVGEYVKHKINQLDEPEVLSQEWIRNNQERKGVHFFVNVTKLQNLLVQKHEELESKIKVLIEAYKQEDGAYSNPENGWISGFVEDLENLVEEEPLYYALIKGHELTDGDKVYWVHDKNNDDMFIGILHSPSVYFLSEMSKSEWNELGINDSNADFVEVKEMEE